MSGRFVGHLRVLMFVYAQTFDRLVSSNTCYRDRQRSSCMTSYYQWMSKVANVQVMVGGNLRRQGKGNEFLLDSN